MYVDDVLLSRFSRLTVAVDQFLDITSDTAILVEDVVIRGQSELGFSIAVFPIFIPNGGYSRITVQATESRQGGGYRVLDEIQRELLIEVTIENPID